MRILILALVVYAIFVAVVNYQAPTSVPVVVAVESNPHDPIRFVNDRADEVRYVYFVPGFMTSFSEIAVLDEGEYRDLLKKVYPNVGSHVLLQYWYSRRLWDMARNNADHFGNEFAKRLKERHPDDLDKVVLVGHSLGGRVVVRTLQALGKDAVHHAVLLGAAINSDDSALNVVGGYKDGIPVGGSIGPVICICNDNDGVLREAYSAKETPKKALGLAGPDSEGLPALHHYFENFHSEKMPRIPLLRSANAPEESDELTDKETEQELRRVFASDKSTEEKLDRIFIQLGSEIERRRSSTSNGSSENALEGDPNTFGAILEALGENPEGFDLPRPLPCALGPIAVERAQGNLLALFVPGIKTAMYLSTHDSHEYLRCFLKRLEDGK